MALLVSINMAKKVHACVGGLKKVRPLLFSLGVTEDSQKFSPALFLDKNKVGLWYFTWTMCQLYKTYPELVCNFILLAVANKKTPAYYNLVKFLLGEIDFNKLRVSRAKSRYSTLYSLFFFERKILSDHTFGSLLAGRSIAELAECFAKAERSVSDGVFDPTIAGDYSVKKVGGVWTLLREGRKTIVKKGGADKGSKTALVKTATELARKNGNTLFVYGANGKLCGIVG
jgi:hypothetical protein